MTHEIFVAVLAFVAYCAISVPAFRLFNFAEDNGDDLQDTIRTIIFPIYIGAVGIYFFALAAFFEKDASFSTVFASSLMVALSGILLGAFLGFLFGIPRSLQVRSNGVGSSGDSSSTEDAHGIISVTRLAYEDNSNLEQISDWLTKIIVGVGLVEANRIFEGIKDLADSLSTSFMDNRAYSLGLIIFSTISGFFMSYLLTRQFFQPALIRLRRRLVNEQMADDFRNEELQTEKALERAGVGRSFLADKHLTATQLEVLKRLKVESDQGKKSYVPKEFIRESKDHEDLRVLRREGLLRPSDGGGWHKGKEIELTTLGKAVAEGAIKTGVTT